MEIQINLTQQQTLSERMIQSAEILQMTQQELEQYIDKQSLENPLIDAEDHRGDAEEGSLRGQESYYRKLEWLSSTDRQNRVYYKQDGRESDQREEWNLSSDKGEDLSEYVYAQMIPWMRTEKDREIYYYLTQSLDSRGYCEETAEDLMDRFGLSEAEAMHCLERLRSADPAGVGAKDLSMCLLLQLERLGLATPPAVRLVTECLEPLGKNQMGKIAAKLSISKEEAAGICEQIRRLNPKPGSGFASRENLQYIYPEIAVVTFKDYFQVVLNDSRTPKIRINTMYQDMLAGELDDEARAYIKTKLNQAEWINRCIEQRGNTILSVMQVIVERQVEFFRLGPGHRSPLRLQDVAEQLGVHESTVSRAVRDKYVQCHWGVYPLNYFFARSFGTEGEMKGTTTESVLEALKAVIAGEDRKKPLSDQKIADCLNEQGIRISRRTVAKYRMELGIKDAGGRKEHE